MRRKSGADEQSEEIYSRMIKNPARKYGSFQATAIARAINKVHLYFCLFILIITFKITFCWINENNCRGARLQGRTIYDVEPY